MLFYSVPSGKFESQKTITSVHFSGYCSIVYDNAFKDCILLEKINYDNMISTICQSAFKGTNLYSVHFNVLDTIGSNAFECCSKLNFVYIPRCSKIDTSAFAYCKSLNAIFFAGNNYFVSEKNKIEIGNSVFKNCISLEYINNDNKIYSIGDYAFECCSKLSNIIIDDCEKIGSYAFRYCENLYYIKASNCRTINNGAFLDCRNLSELNIDNLDLNLTTLTDRVNTHFDENENRIEEVDHSVDMLDQRISAAEANVLTFQARITEVEDKLDSFATKEALNSIRLQMHINEQGFVVVELVLEGNIMSSIVIPYNVKFEEQIAKTDHARVDYSRTI